MLFIQRGTGDPQGDHPDITVMVDWASNTKSLTYPQGIQLGNSTPPPPPPTTTITLPPTTTQTFRWGGPVPGTLSSSVEGGLGR